MPYRVNPRFRPAVIAQTRADGELNCKPDWQQQAERQKQDFSFAGRVGLLGGESRLFNEGETVTLVVSSSTDALGLSTDPTMERQPAVM